MGGFTGVKTGWMTKAKNRGTGSFYIDCLRNTGERRTTPRRFLLLIFSTQA